MEKYFWTELEVNDEFEILEETISKSLAETLLKTEKRFDVSFNKHTINFENRTMLTVRLNDKIKIRFIHGGFPLKRSIYDKFIVSNLNSDSV